MLAKYVIMPAGTTITYVDPFNVYNGHVDVQYLTSVPQAHGTPITRMLSGTRADMRALATNWSSGDHNLPWSSPDTLIDKPVQTLKFTFDGASPRITGVLLESVLPEYNACSVREGYWTKNGIQYPFNITHNEYYAPNVEFDSLILVSGDGEVAQAVNDVSFPATPCSEITLTITRATWGGAPSEYAWLHPNSVPVDIGGEDRLLANGIGTYPRPAINQITFSYTPGTSEVAGYLFELGG
jgi:hypothetical protein